MAVFEENKEPQLQNVLVLGLSLTGTQNTIHYDIFDTTFSCNYLE